MNILFTITSYPPSIGGAQLYLHELAKRVCLEHHAEVVSFFDSNRTDWLLGTTLKTPEKESSYIYENVKVKRIFFTKKEKIIMLPYVSTYYLNKSYNINSIAKFILKKLYSHNSKIDLVHNVRVGREPLSYASFYLAKTLNIPFVFTPLHHPRWDHWFFKEYHRLYREADALFALTAYEKGFYENLGVKKEKVYICGTGPVISDKAELENFRKKYNLTGNIILFIGQGYEYKGILELLKAAKIVFQKVKDVNFIFIGPHTNYSQKLFSKNMDGRIRHIGKIDTQTKSDALYACDIFCLPSKQESFGAVYLEAWSFKKPVIGLDIPQLRCLVENGKDGFLVPPNPNDIANKIIELLENANLRREMGENGKKKVKNNFTWDILYRKTLSAYSEIIRNYENQNG